MWELDCKESWALKNWCLWTVVLEKTLEGVGLRLHKDGLISSRFCVIRASLVAQRLKGLPAMQETWVRSLGQEDLLEKEMATHSSILAWRIPWTEEPGGLQSMGSQRVRHNFTFTFCVIIKGGQCWSRTSWSEHRHKAGVLPLESLLFCFSHTLMYVDQIMVCRSNWLLPYLRCLHVSVVHWIRNVKMFRIPTVEGIM